MENTTRLLSMITVVMVTRNHQEAVLQSLAVLPRKLGQVLVIDNASTDSTVARIRQHFPHVQLLQNTQNEGMGFALNRGLRVAETPYVLLLSPEVVLHESELVKLVRRLECYPEADGMAPLLYQGKDLLPSFGRGFGREYPDQKFYRPAGDICADRVRVECLLLQLTLIRRYQSYCDVEMHSSLAGETLAYAIMESEGSLMVTPQARAEWIGRRHAWDAPRTYHEAFDYGWDDACLHAAYGLQRGHAAALWRHALSQLCFALAWLLVLQPWHAVPYFGTACGMLAYLWGQIGEGRLTTLSSE